MPVYCGDRFCPVCSVPRKLRVRRRLQYLVDAVKLKKGVRIRFLTLTIRSEPDLPKMLKNLLRSFRKLRQRAFWKNAVIGGAFVIEVTGRPGNWHGHLHMIIESYWVPQSFLLKLWMKCSTGRGVWIKLIPAAAAVKECTKYLSKPDMPDIVSTEISASLKGYRLFQPFGSWFAINLQYEMPKPMCSNCKAVSCFILYDTLEGRFPTPEYMKVPESETPVYRSVSENGVLTFKDDDDNRLIEELMIP